MVNIKLSVYMAIVLKDGTIKYIVKVFLLFFLLLVLGLVGLIFYFLSDKEIRYENNSSKKVEMINPK
jgi:hypothetical protein